MQFVAPGIIGMTILFSAVFSGVGLLWDRQFGFLKETLVAPVPRIQVMLGRTLGAATVAVIQGLLVAVVCVVAGFRPADYRELPLALLFMGMIASLFASLGTAIGSALQNIQGFQMIMSFLVMPIFFLSGALYPLTQPANCAQCGGESRSAGVRRGRPANHSDRRFPLRHGLRCLRPGIGCYAGTLHRQSSLFEDSGLGCRERGAKAHTRK